MEELNSESELLVNFRAPAELAGGIESLVRLRGEVVKVKEESWQGGLGFELASAQVIVSIVVGVASLIKTSLEIRKLLADHGGKQCVQLESPTGASVVIDPDGSESDLKAQISTAFRTDA